jgi:hypothetical protein
MQRTSRLATYGGGALLVGVCLTFGSQDVTAADHLDSPGTTADPACDLADVFAWGTEDGNVVLAVTFAGPITGDNPVYDPDTLYTFHIDTTADGMSEAQIYVRFGQNMLDEWGVQLIDVPGSSGEMVGAVNTAITDGDVQAQAGIFDDPFFFDFMGFVATREALVDDTDAADIMFSSIIDPDTGPVDFFAGANEMGIVVEFPATELPDGATAFHTWVSSSRITDGGGSSGSSGG